MASKNLGVEVDVEFPMTRSNVAVIAVMFVLAVVVLVTYENQASASDAISVTVHVDAQGIVSFEGVPIGDAAKRATLDRLEELIVDSKQQSPHCGFRNPVNCSGRVVVHLTLNEATAKVDVDEVVRVIAKVSPGVTAHRIAVVAAE